MKKKLFYSYKYFIAFCMLLFVIQRVLIAEANNNKSMNQKLIITVTPQEQYEGLLHLGLLEAEVLTEENVEEAVINVSESIVKIVVNGYIGSGVIYDVTKDNLIIVSNKHLLMNDVVGRVSVNDNSFLQGNILGLSDQYDVGFIAVPTNQLTTEQLKSIISIQREQTQYDKLSSGSTIFQIGSTDGVGANVYEGTVLNPWEFISDFNSFMLHTNCYAKPGMSGGGVYDAYGYFVGMITGGKEEQTVCVPLSIITSEYQCILEKTH